MPLGKPNDLLPKVMVIKINQIVNTLLPIELRGILEIPAFLFQSLF